MAHASQMYELTLDQTTNLIGTIGTYNTVLAEGHMGIGKSTLLKMLADMFPEHHPFYFDCTTKDLGDVMIPNIKSLDVETDGTDFVQFVPNEELGLHIVNKPVIIMIDEYGKANPGVRRALNRLMLERKMGGRTLHPDSIVFATTNLGAENVGDMMQAHELNRITRVRVAKPSIDDWIAWGINNGLDHTLLAWVKDNPQVFQTFEDVKDPQDNPYIFHPGEQRVSFVTPRSLEKASNILKQRDKIDSHTTTAGLIGTIGDRAAMDLMAHVAVGDQLPSLQSIKETPNEANVPTSPAAVCMVVYRTLATIESDWVNNWMDYLVRLDKEAQALFANGVRKPKYAKQALMFTNKKFANWARENGYMFAADRV